MGTPGILKIALKYWALCLIVCHCNIAFADNTREATAGLIQPSLSKCSRLVAGVNKGLSLDRFFDQRADIESSFAEIAGHQQVQDMPDYDSLLKHLRAISLLLEKIGYVWSSQEKDGYKVMDVWTARQDFTDCPSFNFGDSQVCKLSDLKVALAMKAEKEIAIIRTGLVEGF